MTFTLQPWGYTDFRYTGNRTGRTRFPGNPAKAPQYKNGNRKKKLSNKLESNIFRTKHDFFFKALHFRKPKKNIFCRIYFWNFAPLALMDKIKPYWTIFFLQNCFEKNVNFFQQSRIRRCWRLKAQYVGREIYVTYFFFSKIPNLKKKSKYLFFDKNYRQRSFCRIFRKFN